MLLSSKGYIVSKKCVDVNKIVNELTVKPYSDFNKDEDEFCLCMETSKNLYVPKYYGLQTFGKPTSITIPEPQLIKLAFRGQLLPQQMDPVKAYLNVANDPLKMGGILQLPPGSGKTVMALYIISQLSVKTLIIVHKDFLLNQWKERINEYLPHARIGIIKQKTIQTKNIDISIASLQSLSMKEYEKDTFNTFGLVVIDECHHIAAQIFSKALSKINFKYALGLSATVNRKDGLSKVFKWFIGDIVYKIQTKQNVECQVLLAKFKDRHDDYSKEHVMYNGKVNISKMINSISQYDSRTQYIVQTLKNVLCEEPSRNVIILSDRRNHLERIQEILAKEFDVGLYVGGMKNDHLEISKTKKIILGTFNMVSEGFDLPKLDTLVLATPKSDIEQSVGRIQRKHILTKEDNIPLIIDIVDDFSIFANQFNKRKAFYNKKKYTILKE